MTSILAVSLLLTLAGCLCLYLASPHQRLVARPWEAHTARTVAVLVIAVGLLGLCLRMQPVAAVFTLVTAAMTGLALWPYLGWVWPSRDRRAGE